MIDEDFRTLLAAQSIPAGTPVEKGKISEEQATVRVLYQVADSTQDVHLGGQTGLTTTAFDVECGAREDDSTAQNMAGTLKTALNAFRGAAGSSSILGIFVEDHSDEYQPMMLDSDVGYFIASFRANVIHL